MALKPTPLALILAGSAGLSLLSVSSAIAQDAPTLATPEQSTVEAAEQEEELSAEERELEELRKELELVNARHELEMQRLQAEFHEWQLEQQRLTMEAQMKDTVLQAELAEAQREMQRLNTARALAEAKLQQQYMAKEMEVSRLTKEHELAMAEATAELNSRYAMQELLLANVNKEHEMAMAQLQVEFAEQEIEMARSEKMHEMAMAAVAQQQAKLDLVDAAHSLKIQEFEGKLALREATDHANAIVVDEINYKRDPFEDGTLYISDRRIPLNGPIISGTSTYFTDRIHYYNNLSEELPIFLVIDSCPGGSVMEGYRMMEAIENSKAPVHVVVKQYAASMAAIITTMADHSYAYPNAVIMHHQMSAGTRGNMTEQAEQLETQQEWARRIMEPLSEKMGMTPDQLVEAMYENDSTGDWSEFADEAEKLNWVADIVYEIREQGMRNTPTSEMPRPFFFFFQAEGQDMNQYGEEVDSRGERFVRLPQPRPFDFYFMHNPNDYYRW